MKKHHRWFLAGMILCVLLLAACSAQTDTADETDKTDIIEKTEKNETNEEIETSKVPSDFTKGYMKADFEAMNSPAEENGLGDTPVYIECQLTDLAVETSSHGTDVYAAIATDKDNNKWFVGVNADVFAPMSEYEQFLEKDIVLCGVYDGFSKKYKMPVIWLEELCDIETGITKIGINYYTESKEKESTKPEENTQPTEQPKQEETVKLSDDFVIAFVKSSLKSAKLDYQDVYIEDGVIYSSVIMPEGTATGIVLKDKATLDAWVDVCDAITDYSVALTKSLSDLGRDDLEAAISLINDSNPENFMFLVVNGLVLYNVTD